MHRRFENSSEASPGPMKKDVVSSYSWDGVVLWPSGTREGVSRGGHAFT
jgi:hypothetical protein